MLQIFNKLNLKTEMSYKYFLKDGKEQSMRNEFLTLVQGLQIQTNEEELIGLYNFFDERNYGEINKQTFIEKCEIAKDFYKWTEKDSGTSEKKGSTTLTLRQHVMSTLEKIYMYFMEKKYNKKQMYAVFDKYGTGMISREEFISMLRTLKVQIQSDHEISVLNFIDPTESGVINLNYLIKRIDESVPDHTKDALKNTQAQGILAEIVSKLKIHHNKFISEFLDLEKKLQISDILNRSRTGVAIFDFYKLLTSYGIRLQENEKLLMNSAFRIKKMPDYFDTESLYQSLELVSEEMGVFSQVETDNLEFWEGNVLRKVADRLRSMNLTLEKAFSGKMGFISTHDFKQLLISLQIDLSQKDIDLLVKRLATNSNPNIISLEDFKQRFWACFFKGKANLNPLNIETKSRQIATMFLHQIKIELMMPLSYAWDKLDRSKTGFVLMGDLKEFLLEIKMPITKEDLGCLFCLIDESNDSQIDQFEFAEFWKLALPINFDKRKNKLKRIESDILGQIVKKVHATDTDLFSLTKKYDPHNCGYLDERQFRSMMADMKININDADVRSIMKIVCPDNPERMSHSHLETALLKNGMKPQDKKDMVIVTIDNRLLSDFLN